MARLLVAALLAAGCNGPRYPSDPHVEPPVLPVDTGDSGVVTTVPAPRITATCNVTDNALRYLCTVHVETPQPVEITYYRRDEVGPVRTHTSELPATDHTIGLYFLAHHQKYRFVARAPNAPELGEVTGTFTTGDVPIGAKARFELLEGTSSAPLLGMVSPCSDGAYAVVVDPATDDLLWYHDFSTSPIGFMDGVVFTEDQTVLAIADGALREVDLMGNVLLELLPETDLPNRVHHDVYRKDGMTYALFQEVRSVGDGEFLLDGFYVIDALGAIVAEWHLIDHFVPFDPGGIDSPFAQDYSHANAIWVDDQHNVLISFRHLSAIALVIGDVASPDFGTVQWRLANPTSPFGNDFELTSLVGPPDDFQRQHNVHLLPNGRVLMLDNRMAYFEMSRAIELVVDPSTMQAEIVRQYVLPTHCDFQGGAMLTPAGNVLATCAPSRDGYEFDSVTGAVAWHGSAVCSLGFGSYIPRFVPLDW